MILSGEAALPDPVPVGMDELRSGRLDCQRIEMHGIVRAARLDEVLVPPRLILKIATPSGECDAWVLAFSPGDGERLVDAELRVRGVCLGWENPRRQLTNIRLLVGSMEDLAIERAAPPDAFAAPLVAPDALLRCCAIAISLWPPVKLKREICQRRLSASCRTTCLLPALVASLFTRTGKAWDLEKIWCLRPW